MYLFFFFFVCALGQAADSRREAAVGVCGDGPAGPRLCSSEGAPAAAWLEVFPACRPSQAAPGSAGAPEDGDGDGGRRAPGRIASGLRSAGVSATAIGENPWGRRAVLQPETLPCARLSCLSEVSAQLGMPLCRAGFGFGRAPGKGERLCSSELRGGHKTPELLWAQQLP